MLNPNPDTGIDFILNVETTSLVDVHVTTQAVITPSFATTLPPPPNPLIIPQQQTPIPTTTNALIPPLQDLPKFGSLFGFDTRLKTMEDNFSEFKQTNQFATALSSIPNIVDNYLGSKLKDAVDKIIKEQVKAQVKKQVSKILPKIKQSVNDQLEAELLTQSSNEAQTSHAVAAKLSELELKKILMDKMEMNKSIDRSTLQKNLYNALRRRDDHDEDEEPSAGSNRGSKRRRDGKEPESTSALKEKTSKTTGKSTEGSKSYHKSVGQSAQIEEPMYTTKDLEEPTHQEFETGVTEDQPVDETVQPSDWFQKPTRLPSPDRDWNKTLPANHGPVQPWLSNLARKEDPRKSFDELMDTPLDFSAFVMNRLNVDTLSPELLAGPTFELMKGTCKSLVKLEYFFE
ncbi:hypothetical protein Tco_1134333 [Tanacetum coccineum]